MEKQINSGSRWQLQGYAGFDAIHCFRYLPGILEHLSLGLGGDCPTVISRKASPWLFNVFVMLFPYFRHHLYFSHYTPY